MSYRIDLKNPGVFVPCTFVPSQAAPGKTLCVNEDGSLLVIEPDGSERPGGEPAGGPHWDSPYTWGTVIGGFLVYRSASGPNPGVSRGYKMVV